MSVPTILWCGNCGGKDFNTNMYAHLTSSGTVMLCLTCYNTLTRPKNASQIPPPPSRGGQRFTFGFGANRSATGAAAMHQAAQAQQAAQQRGQQVGRHCNRCGDIITTGTICSVCASQMLNDIIMSDTPKISSEAIKWKEHFEGLGMPWNFYLALLQAAKDLRSLRPDMTTVDKDGWLIIKYEDHWVKLKISEITVEPPG